MVSTIFASGSSRELIALINAAPYAREAVERHQREVLDQYQPTLTTSSPDAHRQAIADNNALNDAAAYALDRVALFPAANAADLHTKLSFMAEHDMGNGCDWVAQLLADVERITAAGGQA
jgi:hypothetical protein